VRWPALAATGVSLGGFSLCSVFADSPSRQGVLWVGLGLLLAFAGFVGVSLAMILDSDREG
jgi:hypothetical protein